MKLVVLGDESLKEEFISGIIQEQTQITWISSAEQFMQYKNADAFFDLSFQPEASRIGILKSLDKKPVFINDPLNKKPDDPHFIRINGLPTFLKRSILEASCTNESLKSQAESVIESIGKKIEWVPDIPGFVTFRVIAMIINEAYFALGENVSDKKNIDMAMKLGTNYPYGPFEWSEKIGLKNVYDLLVELNKTNGRYEPAPLLKNEALS